MNSTYFTKHLITYIGNKRKLVNEINNIFIEIKNKLNKEYISSFDGFSGSGVIARVLKSHSHTLYTNDLEEYTNVINNCYLITPSDKDKKLIIKWINVLNTMEYTVTDGLIRTYYSPLDDTNIQSSDRTFYTNENAIIIDSMRKKIDEAPSHIKNYLLAPLLIKASIHVNTSGIFKGFHKKDGIGHFGGNGENALQRILKKIVLDCPVYGDFSHDTHVENMMKDTNEVIKDLPHVDIVYYDPPYNQHPYGSNYFMLNLIVKNQLSVLPSGISGITPWNRSNYNYKKSAKESIYNLLKDTKSSFIIMSYNNEGILDESDWKDVLQNYSYKIIEIKYATYKGSRNLNGRSKDVKEMLIIIDKRIE